MAQQPRFSVTVSNIGTVAEADYQEDIAPTYEDYVQLSKDGYGRAGGEDVTLWDWKSNCGPIAEHEGSNPSR